MNTLERLKELEAKATPGPWSTFDRKDGSSCLVDVEYDGAIVDEMATKDAQFIAEMRNALPDLLRVVEEAQALEKFLITRNARCEDGDEVYCRGLTKALAALKGGGK